MMKRFSITCVESLMRLVLILTYGMRIALSIFSNRFSKGII